MIKFDLFIIRVDCNKIICISTRYYEFQQITFMSFSVISSMKSNLVMNQILNMAVVI